MSYAPDADLARREPHLEGDADQDGLPDIRDACPDVAEDADGWQDEDGCPDDRTAVNLRVVDHAGAMISLARVSISDGDGATEDLVGGDKDLELSAGVWTVTAAAGGFAPTTQTVEVVDGPPQAVVLRLSRKEGSRVVVRSDRIELEETVHFGTSSSDILPTSTDLLDEVARLLIAYPEIRRLSIEGHTDSRGDAAFNLDLSRRRAAAVLGYLAQHGVASERLSSEGYGESRPLDPYDSPEAWAQNRRVELIVKDLEDQ